MFTPTFSPVPCHRTTVNFATTSAEPNRTERRSTLVSWSRRGYLLASTLFTVGVLAQVYIAGMAVFVDSARWGSHVAFGTTLPIFLVPMFVLAFAGELPWTLKLLPVGLFALFAVQFSTAHRFGSLVGAVHPVNALVIFWLATVGVRRAWPWGSERATTPNVGRRVDFDATASRPWQIPRTESGESVVPVLRRERPRRRRTSRRPIDT